MNTLKYTRVMAILLNSFRSMYARDQEQGSILVAPGSTQTFTDHSKDCFQ